MAKVSITCFFLLCGLFLIPEKNSGQCASNEFLDNCATSLGTYTFIKAFHIKIKPRKKYTIEYSYIFSKGSSYIIVICDRNIEGKRMITNLYDRSHKLVVSNYDKENSEYHSYFVYPCTATGVYYIESYFEGTKGGCGVNIIGFSKSGHNIIEQ